MRIYMYKYTHTDTCRIFCESDWVMTRITGCAPAVSYYFSIYIYTYMCSL